MRSVIAEGEYGYQRVNVATEQRDPNSLINWMERLIRTRQQCQELGIGSWQIYRNRRTMCLRPLLRVATSSGCVA
ncbi:hypothetical protein [Gloeocapsopsis sp. IPPAS B-1203]|uniref:hypothetical protein n=1 Tax=Gloeocapsopsis sp. IPPAS B-1203 TaxID=2049454 RepID=UPI0025A145DA|nr:hypothetical protein [Gloeocapsopsis sp. IPPAS B-1203]